MSTNTLNNYVYVWLRDDGFPPSPYYIGRGINQRDQQHHRGIGKPRKKEVHRIIRVYENLTFEESSRLEINLISLYGRIDLGTGLLHNRTDGGEGNNNSIKTKWINNGIENLRIGPKDSIPFGWTEGRHSPWVSNCFYINDGTENRKLPLGNTIPKGWVEGRLSSNTKGMFLINNNIEEKYIVEGQAIPEGYTKGRLWRHSAEARESIREGNSKFCWITDGINNKRQLKTDCIPIGWRSGRYVPPDQMPKRTPEIIAKSIETRKQNAKLIPKEVYQKGWETRRKNDNHKVSEESRKKISEANRGRVKSVEERQKISERNKLRVGDKHPMYGKKRPEEWKKAQSIRIKQWHADRKKLTQNTLYDIE
jgi:hypothetical protein